VLHTARRWQHVKHLNKLLQQEQQTIVMLKKVKHMQHIHIHVYNLHSYSLLCRLAMECDWVAKSACPLTATLPLSACNLQLATCHFEMLMSRWQVSVISGLHSILVSKL